MTVSSVLLISLVALLCGRAGVFVCRAWSWQERPRRLCRCCRWVCQPEQLADGALVCPICKTGEPLSLGSEQASAYFQTLRSPSPERYTSTPGRKRARHVVRAIRYQRRRAKASGGVSLRSGGNSPENTENHSSW